MNQEGLERLLAQVQEEQVTVKEALQRLRSLPFEDLGFASLDHHRSLRQGFPEVVLCEGKTAAQILSITRALIKKGGPLLATRVTPAVARAICRLDRRARHFKEARIVAIPRARITPLGQVLVVTAGTADVPVAEEARVTAEIMGSHVERLYDVGVAGIHRLLGRKERLFSANVDHRHSRDGRGAPERRGRIGRLPGRGGTDKPRLWGQFRRVVCPADDAQFLRSRGGRDEYRQRLRSRMSRASHQPVGGERQRLRIRFTVCDQVRTHPAVHYFTSNVPRFGQATMRVRGPLSPLSSSLMRTS